MVFKSRVDGFGQWAGDNIFRVLEELAVDAVWTCDTAIWECSDGGLNFFLHYRGVEGPLGALKWPQQLVLLVSKLLPEPVFDGPCFAFVHSHEVVISVLDNDGQGGFH